LYEGGNADLRGFGGLAADFHAALRPVGIPEKVKLSFFDFALSLPRAGPAIAEWSSPSLFNLRRSLIAPASVPREERSVRIRQIRGNPRWGRSRSPNAVPATPFHDALHGSLFYNDP
jgi:hypothetical protein